MTTLLTVSSDMCLHRTSNTSQSSAVLPWVDSEAILLLVNVFSSLTRRGLQVKMGKLSGEVRPFCNCCVARTRIPLDVIDPSWLLITGFFTKVILSVFENSYNNSELMSQDSLKKVACFIKLRDCTYKFILVLRVVYT